LWERDAQREPHFSEKRKLKICARRLGRSDQFESAHEISFSMQRFFDAARSPGGGILPAPENIPRPTSEPENVLSAEMAHPFRCEMDRDQWLSHGVPGQRCGRATGIGPWIVL
jgi:hypothetical protein